MIGMIQFGIYLMAAHLIYKGIEILFIAHGHGRGLLQQAAAWLLLFIAILLAVVITHRADTFAQTINSTLNGL